MTTLQDLKNTHRPKKKVQRVGRGVGSKRGKTCCRGVKGDKARSGYKRHFGREGGQLPLYRKLPCRGFDSARFAKEVFAINFDLVNRLFKDGEVVSLETLRKKHSAPREVLGGLKVLAGKKPLTKKVSFEAQVFSEGAKKLLDEKSLSYKVVPHQ